MGGAVSPPFYLTWDKTMGFPCGSAGKESACNVGDLVLIPGLGRSPGEGKGYPLQHSDLESSMDFIVHGVTKSRTRLSSFHFHIHARNIVSKALNTVHGMWWVLSKILCFSPYCFSFPFSPLFYFYFFPLPSPFPIRNWIPPLPLTGVGKFLL